MTADRDPAPALPMAPGRPSPATAQLTADRERIARDLHDHVIQRLFAVGLSLQAQLRTVADGELHERIDHAVGEIDQAIADLRATIFDLKAPQAAARSLRRRLAEIAAAAGADERSPRVAVTVTGPADTVVDANLADDVVAVVREAVANAVKYAQATTVRVELAVRDALALTVADDGVGMRRDAARGGLKNIEQRALSHGGEFRVDSVIRGAGAAGGTTLRWRAPLR